MARRRLGQHFLLDPSILKRIVDVAGITPSDTVVEIGPGHGRLTRLLSERASRVIAIEIDPYLYNRLKEEIEGIDNITLIHGDALRFSYDEIGRFKVVANIPYYITTPIIFGLLEHRERLISMTLTVQKEVARRIVASPGTKDYGVLSVIMQYYGEPSLKFIIPRGAFRPPPDVDSAVIRIDILKEPRVKVKDEANFLRIVRAAFGQRRKTLSNALKSLVNADIKEILEKAGIEPMRRGESLTIEEFARLSDMITSNEIKR
jgi:16S rRNA (adenine1518-N6/adenine1519-N6)-dimethyltransferase